MVKENFLHCAPRGRNKHERKRNAGQPNFIQHSVGVNMSEMPEIDSLLEADEKNVREMQKVFAGYQGLPELLNEAAVLYKTCSRAFGQALSQEVSGLPRDLPLDNRSIVAEFVAKSHRGLLFTRIGVLYATAVTDLLRMRLTAPLGYMRLQCESIALLKLMSEDCSIVHQWVNIQTDKDGTAFYHKYQNRVREVLKTYDLLNTYNQTSGSALHSRFIGVAQGFKSARFEDGLRIIQALRINVQEFDPENPHRFMLRVIFTVLRVQALILANLKDIMPEINDKLLLETRIPQFIERVNRFLEIAHTHFAQYFTDVPKKGP